MPVDKGINSAQPQTCRLLKLFGLEGVRALLALHLSDTNGGGGPQQEL